MEMILTGIENKNEYYTNHYFTSIFQDNAEDTIKKWKQKEKQEEIQLPWKKLRDVRTQYYNIRDRYLRSKNEEASKPMIQELATLYLKALGYESINSVCSLSNLFFRFHTTTLTEACSNELKQHHL